MRATVVQTNTTENVSDNLAQIASLVAEACRTDNPDLIVLPEYATILASDQELKDAAEEFPDGRMYRCVQQLARQHKVALHLGSTVEAGHAGKIHNTTVVFGADGAELARYRKIHLFDVTTPGGESYAESDIVERGTEVVTYQLQGRTIGCSICYDVRFPELYARLAHADIIAVPSAFTMETGRAHWDILLRSRAIETQAFVLAPAQVGLHREGTEERACYGNSLIVDAWGTVLARVEDAVGFATADLDFENQAAVRANLPVLQHHIMSDFGRSTVM